MSRPATDYALFFPPNSQVLALPSWRSPRLYVASQDAMQRWTQSSFYPAYRRSARLYRVALRLRAAARLAKVHEVYSKDWPLQEFVQDMLPQLASAVVMVGTPGPSQELTVQLRDERNGVVGYLKYAEKEAARRRLRQELSMLTNIPDGLGPKPLKFGSLGNGEALLKSALSGQPLLATLPPPEDVVSFPNTLVFSTPMDLEAHPWVRRVLRDWGTPELDECLEPLAHRDWPVTVQHGDFTPWNLLRAPNGNLGAVDWEYGTLEGFPHLDIAHYVLQCTALIYRRTPREAARYTVKYLSGQPSLGLSSAEACALTRLAAYDAYQKNLEDGEPPSKGLQPLRQTIWKHHVHDA